MNQIDCDCDWSGVCDSCRLAGARAIAKSFGYELKPIEPVNQQTPEDPMVVYLVVRESLQMSAGKTAAQVGHAIGMIYQEWAAKSQSIKAGDLSYLAQVCAFENWQKENYRKVVLKADDTEWARIQREVEYFKVTDMGLTEIPVGSETCMVLWPIRKSSVPKCIKRLQVLK